MKMHHHLQGDVMQPDLLRLTAVLGLSAVISVCGAAYFFYRNLQLQEQMALRALLDDIQLPPDTCVTIGHDSRGLFVETKGRETGWYERAIYTADGALCWTYNGGLRERFYTCYAQEGLDSDKLRRHRFQRLEAFFTNIGYEGHFCIDPKLWKRASAPTLAL